MSSSVARSSQWLALVARMSRWRSTSRWRRAELYPPGADRLWVLHASKPGAGVYLASVGLEISAQALWAEVLHEPAGGPPAHH
jgi:hypothetical protein